MHPLIFNVPVQVHRMQLTCVLHGGHKTASTTAVSW